MKNHTRKRDKHQHLRGAAAVEMAFALPVLVLMLLGTIDLGQFVNVGQVISNASRVAARKASVYDTVSVSQVQAEVVNYLNNYFPKQSASTLQSATTVSVALSDGTAITGNGIDDLQEGVKIAVTVQFDYSAVRWVNGITMLNNRPISVTTTIRRLE